MRCDSVTKTAYSFRTIANLGFIAANNSNDIFCFTKNLESTVCRLPSELICDGVPHCHGGKKILLLLVIQCYINNLIFSCRRMSTRSMHGIFI